MNKVNNMGTLSATLLISNLILAKFFLTMPRMIVQESANAAWISVGIKGLLALFIFAIIINLYKPFSGDDIIDIAGEALGSIGGKIVGIGFVVFLILMVSNMFRIFSDAVRTVAMYHARDEFISFFLVVAMVAAAYYGIEAIGNVNLIISTLVFLSIIGITLTLAKNFDINHIMPLFGSGVQNVITSAVSKNSSYYEFLALFFIAPYLNGYKNIRRVGFNAILISSIIAFVIVLSYCLIVPYPASGEFILPLYQLTRLIKVGTFWQRIESLIIFIWMGLLLKYIGSGLYFITSMFKKLFNLKYYKPMISIFALIIFFTAFALDSEFHTMLMSKVLYSIGIIMYPVVPLIVLIIARGKRANAKSN